MALVKCPECGTDVSDKAAACISCGYPISELKFGGTVEILIPAAEDILGGWTRQIVPKGVSICTLHGEKLWNGSYGEIADFEIDSPVTVVIDLGTCENLVEGNVRPNTRYRLVQHYGTDTKEAFYLSEIENA